MREINEIIIHCSATKTNQSFTVDDIRDWHTSAPRNWSDIGYHFYIQLDGTVWHGRPLERSGAHTIGRNKNSIGVCFEGGYNPDGSLWDGPTDEQILNYKELRSDLNSQFGELPESPHNKYANKDCPAFDIEILK